MNNQWVHFSEKHHFSAALWLYTSNDSVFVSIQLLFPEEFNLSQEH